MNFLKKAFEFVRFPGQSRTTAVIVLFLILAAIPLTVIISQQQQQLRQRAAESPACQTIDSIPGCKPPYGPTCKTEGERCKIDNIIWECQRQ